MSVSIPTPSLHGSLRRRHARPRTEDAVGTYIHHHICLVCICPRHSRQTHHRSQDSSHVELPMSFCRGKCLPTHCTYLPYNDRILHTKTATNTSTINLLLPVMSTTMPCICPIASLSLSLSLSSPQAYRERSIANGEASCLART